MLSKKFSLTLDNQTITAEFTDLAEGANGSVLLTMGETTIFVTAMQSSHASDKNYFPLSVEFEEKFYAVGQILGSRFMRREGKPSDDAILAARLIDRTIRPYFDQSIRQDIQVIVSVLALGDEDPATLGVIGASLALATSDIPWGGPLGAVRIGRRLNNGAIIINPGYADRNDNALDFEVLSCGRDGTINMIETTAFEVSESDLLAALTTASALHAQLEHWQHDIISQIGKTKQAPPQTMIPSELFDLYHQDFKQHVFATIFSDSAGSSHIANCKNDFVTAAKEIGIESTVADQWFHTQIRQTLHEGVLSHNRRPDGRGFTAVRELYAKAGGVSPVLHGSGIFYRGGTHIFTALTLDGPETALQLSTIEHADKKKYFMHHYNFPPFSVGETGRVGGFNRRATGHGALAEKALAPVIPKQPDFPYTIRLVSETLSSNGSSSMGSVCASTLALMDGGVPILRPVAGIAIGVMTNGDDYRVLTDIQGPEDEFGDMDLKVAGTNQGITAMQMDVSESGIPVHIISEALEAARVARLQILETILQEIPSPRTHISPRAPHIISLQIQPEQIGLVIGSGGKTINKIQEDSQVNSISVNDDGAVFITGTKESSERAADLIKNLTRIYQLGEELEVTVIKLTSFGAFAKIDDQQEGLIHISQIAPFRIDKTADVLAVGEVVKVAVSQVEKGRIGLSIKAIDPHFATSKGIEPPQTVKKPTIT